MLAGTETDLDRTHAVVVERCALRRHPGTLVRLVLLGPEGASFDERHALIEHRRITCSGHVVERCVDEPEPIVRESRAHTLATGLVPPVLHVAFDELPRGRVNDLVACEVRRGKDQRHHVLQLITETERTTRLVEGGSPPDPAGESLVEQPAIQQHIGRRIGCLDLYRPQQRVPEPLHILERGADALWRAAPAYQRRGAGGGRGFAEQSDDRSLLARFEVDADLNGPARIERGAGTVRERRLARAQPVRRAYRSVR